MVKSPAQRVLPVVSQIITIPCSRCRPRRSGRYFSGFLDELSVFDQALSERQIRDLQQQRTLCGGQEQVCVVPELNSSSFAQDWTATTFNNSTPPSIVNGRIRLTSNQNNQSTALSLNQSVPARGHLTEVVFRMYAYAGSGADGIALVFSDSTGGTAGQLWRFTGLRKRQ